MRDEKKERVPMSFVGKLQEQTKFYEERTFEVEDLFSRAAKAAKGNNLGESESLILRAEISLNMVGELARAFETIYECEFEILDHMTRKELCVARWGQE